MEYNILMGTNIVSLIAQVNSHLKDGWILQGGVSVASDDWLYQAMVKPVKNNDFNERPEYHKCC